eukprot:TRINITY_DN10416_c0_g1_i4.p1 TRINITY_DN10416_c0_g1~~TRINITY_DN10416_c0_g1_i4.p1  ORF type:complete len:467 (-),score=23.22 TRINITY_DN10416_c0_g1_i4:201-1601(-)
MSIRLYSWQTQMDSDQDECDVIRAPIAPQVPMMGVVGAPLQTLPFSKYEENENLPYLATKQTVEESNGWIAWDISDVIQHLPSYRKPAPMCFYSPVFFSILGKQALQWQMCLAVVDIDQNHASLYIGSFDCQNDRQLFLETTFSVKLSLQEGECLQYQDFVDDIQHVYQTRSCWWGIQQILDMRCWGGFSGRIIVELKIHKCQRIGTSLNFGYKYLIHEEPHVFKVCNKPSILCVENFLSSEECQQFIQLAKPHLSPSLVQSGGLTNHRKSSSMFFIEDLKQLQIVKIVEKRLQNLINLPIVLDGYTKQKPQETLQVIHYKQGEFYRPHLDNKDNQQPTRAATIIVYLNDVQEGGCTNFKLAQHLLSYKQQGLKIHPKAGRLILFWNREKNCYVQDLQTLHEAEPVIKGEKWILTRWFKDEIPPTYNQWLQQKQNVGSTQKLFKKWKNSCDTLISNAAVPFSNKNK